MALAARAFDRSIDRAIRRSVDPSLMEQACSSLVECNQSCKSHLTNAPISANVGGNPGPIGSKRGGGVYDACPINLMSGKQKRGHWKLEVQMEADFQLQFEYKLKCKLKLKLKLKPKLKLKLKLELKLELAEIVAKTVAAVEVDQVWAQQQVKQTDNTISRRGQNNKQSNESS